MTAWEADGPGDAAIFRGSRSTQRWSQIASDSIAAMAWGAVELEPEVTNWLDTLTDEEFGRAERYIDLSPTKAYY